MSWCEGCQKPHQTTTHLADRDDGWHLEYLCTPCYQVAGHWDDIDPTRFGWQNEEKAA